MGGGGGVLCERTLEENAVSGYRSGSVQKCSTGSKAMKYVSDEEVTLHHEGTVNVSS